MSSATTMNVDIISDVVCPWCVVAYRQLTCAAAQLDQPLELNVRWHPFELNPQMASGGQDLHEHAQEKYGTTLAQNTQGRERLQREGQMVGITFNYSDASRIYNTFSAHQLLHWQQGSPKQQTALKEATTKKTALKTTKKKRRGSLRLIHGVTRQSQPRLSVFSCELGD